MFMGLEMIDTTCGKKEEEKECSGGGRGRRTREQGVGGDTGERKVKRGGEGRAEGGGRRGCSAERGVSAGNYRGEGARETGG